MPVFEASALALLVTAAFSYLVGSIPFGVLVTKAMGLGDLRKIGSGNIGATNVLRTGNKAAALATLILDGGKGAVAVLVARACVGPDAAQVAALASFLGHLYPVWLKFKGGKGVATFLGTLLALDWRLGLAACAIWLVTALVTRISSLSALVAAALSPLVALWLDGPRMALVLAFMAVLIFIRHHANIARIRTGTEPRIGKKS